MVNVDIFDDETKAKTAKSTYQKLGRPAELFQGLGITVDDHRVDPPINVYADRPRVWVVVTGQPDS